MVFVLGEKLGLVGVDVAVGISGYQVCCNSGLIGIVGSVCVLDL
jgi:hypothetical protein